MHGDPWLSLRKAERFRLGAKCPESPSNWDFISLLFSDTSFSHLNLMDGEYNDVITRGVDALTGARAGVSSEGKGSEKMQDTADS